MCLWAKILKVLIGLTQQEVKTHNKTVVSF